jgi:hypothetical protein
MATQKGLTPSTLLVQDVNGTSGAGGRRSLALAGGWLLDLGSIDGHGVIFLNQVGPFYLATSGPFLLDH